MLVEIDEKRKIIYFFLSREERDDLAFREALKPQYKVLKEKGYISCVFLSGDEDLKENTTELLKHNIKVMAKKALTAEREALGNE